MSRKRSRYTRKRSAWRDVNRVSFEHFSPLDELLGDCLSVGNLEGWNEVHEGTDTETWVWTGPGLHCFCNGLLCAVRYRR